MSQSNVFERKPITQRRVVVTGMAVISPLGLTLKENWENLLQGKSGIGPIQLFDATAYDARIAGEVKDFNPESYISKKDIKKMDRFIQLGVSAAQQAIQDAGVDFSTDEKLAERTGVIVGVGMGGLPIIEEAAHLIKERGPHRMSPFFIPQVITNMVSGHITIQYGLKGPNFSVTSACATGAHSIGEATKYIRDGICDVMIAGGAESTVTPTGMGGFAAMKALSTRNDQPEAASRPFDRDRDGFVLSEGCGILVLEDYERAARRGAKIYAEITGYGVSSDAFHMTNPAPEGRGAQLAMRMALKDASLNADNLQYINAHGTSTPAGDAIETQAIKAVFPHATSGLWVSSTKSMTGHTLGAAGAIESIYSIMTLMTNMAPPTINLESPSDGCDLDYVPNTAREGKFENVLNNSFGFGGTNASVIFSKISS